MTRTDSSFDSFALPEDPEEVGGAGLLAVGTALLEQWNVPKAKQQIADAMTYFGPDPDRRPADVLAASAYVWARCALPLITAAPYSGPPLDEAAGAVMRLVMARPEALAAIQNPTAQNEDLLSMVVLAADGALINYDVATGARPPGVAPELQAGRPIAHTLIADALRVVRGAST